MCRTKVLISWPGLSMTFGLHYQFYEIQFNKAVGQKSVKLFGFRSGHLVHISVKLFGFRSGPLVHISVKLFEFRSGPLVHISVKLIGFKSGH